MFQFLMPFVWGFSAPMLKYAGRKAFDGTLSYFSSFWRLRRRQRL